MGVEAAGGSSGHRSRLRTRFLRSGLTGMQDYEVIELLLTFAIPRKDVKPLAKFLLEHFGSISNLINASGNELLSIPGIGPQAATLILFMRQFLVRCLDEKIREKKSIDSHDDVRDFLRMKIGCVHKETLIVFYLDSRRHLLDYKIYQGTVDHAAVYAREITEHALLTHACGVILAHNHPSGSSDPSNEDILLTHHLKDTLGRLGIDLLDHVIVTSSGIRSVENLSMPQPLTRAFAVGEPKDPEKAD